MKIDLNRLSRKLQYTFHNPLYLQQALTHCSVGSENYERFEFLGDSILNFVIANALFQRFPEKTEGELSRLRSLLVKGDTLADIAMELKLGDYLLLGPGELKSGGFRRHSILADSLEAVFAAIFLDGGFETAQTTILHVYDQRLSDPNIHEKLKDFKTQLQEYIQARKLSLPKYLLDRVEGSEHNQCFYVSCHIDGLEYTTEGVGASRRKAEQLAAQKMLELAQKKGV